MSACEFTVVIPSHSHGPLLELSGSSALAQTVSEIEVFVVLDGADDETRAAADRLASRDARVRVFDNPKGERVGEAHRDAALGEASGTKVAYLSDDDIWLPHHLATVGEALGAADFVAADTVFHSPDGTFDVRAADLGDRWCRERMLADPPWNCVGLSQGSHTMAAYDSLDRGWHPAPTGIWSDLHMWRQFLRHPDLTNASTGRTSVFTLPSPWRREMTLAERAAELKHWLELALDPERLQPFLEDSISPHLRALANRSSFDRWALQTEHEEALADLEGAHAESERLRAELQSVRESVAFRAARRLAAVPILGAIGGRIGRVIAGRKSADEQPID